MIVDHSGGVIGRGAVDEEGRSMLPCSIGKCSIQCV